MLSIYTTSTVSRQLVPCASTSSHGSAVEVGKECDVTQDFEFKAGRLARSLSGAARLERLERWQMLGGELMIGYWELSADSCFFLVNWVS